MQFDGNDLEKDNNNDFSLSGDDSGAISWEDLLNTDEDVDLSSLIKDKSQKEDVEKDVKPAENITEIQPDSNQYKENETSDNVIDLDEYAKENASESLSFTENDNDIINSIQSDDLLNSSDDSSSAGEDFSDIVDDELLSLLDVKNDAPSAFAERNIEEAVKPELSNASPYISESSFGDDDKENQDVFAGLDILNNQSNNDEVQVKTEEAKTAQPALGADYYAEDDGQSDINVVQSKKAPVALYAIIALIGLFAVIVAILFFVFPSLTGTGANDDIMSADNTNYGIEQNDTGENNNAAGETEKQTEELMNKIEASSKDKKAKKEDEEKKIVVVVPTGGRTNPFVPSSLVDDNGFLSLGADLSIPPDIDVNSPEAVAGRKLMSVVVSGIMYDQSKPSAILKFGGTDYFVQNGDKIDTYTVTGITKDYVQIKNGANIYKAYVGEAFDVGTLPESKQMQNNGGTRQYISADDIQISTK